jgi:hypothetical protein
LNLEVEVVYLLWSHNAALLCVWSVREAHQVEPVRPLERTRDGHHHHHHHHHHHQITTLSHSINAIGPAPHRGGRNGPGMVRDVKERIYAPVPDVHLYM